MENLREELEIILNRASRENESNTPDFILAEYMLKCLAAAELLINRREEWYGGPIPNSWQQNQNRDHL